MLSYLPPNVCDAIPTSSIRQNPTEPGTSHLLSHNRKSVSNPFLSHLRFPPVTCQPLLAAEEEQDRPSTETSSLLSSGPGDIIDDDDDAASKKSTKSCIDITGLALLSKSEFWQLWVLMGLLTGVGLMTIKYVSSESCVSSSLISTATLVTMSRLSGNTGMTRSRTISSLIDNFGTSQ